MSDEVDDLLRRTMATLDRQVPDGYFDTLVSRTLVRLDDPALGELLDLRGDASHDPHDPHDNDAAPAASSPGWKAVALSEPAKPPAGPMLGVVDELARERAAREARAARAGQARGPAPAAPATEQAASMPDRRARSNRRPIAAVAGLGLAAAAGAMIFLGVRDKTASAPEAAQAREQAEVSATTSAPAGAQLAVPSQNTASGSAAPVPVTAGSAAQRDQSAQADQNSGDASQAARPVAPPVKQDAAPGKIGKKPIATKGGGKAASTDEPTKFKKRPSQDAPSEGKPETPWVGKTVPRQDGERAGGKRSKQGVPASNGDKPEAEASSLSSDDIKRGMTAVAARAKACFAGIEGTATVQLTVAPSGRVQKATVTGPFAGTPTGTCVEQAVRAATFPPWDGEPQRFGYDYLLSH